MTHYYYFDIRNGDISYATDENGKFLNGDYIKCGEWFEYTKEEVKDFIELLKYYGLTENATELEKAI